MRPLNLKKIQKIVIIKINKNSVKSKFLPEIASQTNKETSPVACILIRESIWFSVAVKDAIGRDGYPPVP